jgi:hypothetical protein
MNQEFTHFRSHSHIPGFRRHGRKSVEKSALGRANNRHRVAGDGGDSTSLGSSISVRRFVQSHFRAGASNSRWVKWVNLKNRSPSDAASAEGATTTYTFIDDEPYGGYFTRIISKLVGDAGHVYVIGAARLATAPPLEHSPSTRAPPESAPAALEAAGACQNVTADKEARR